MPYPPEIGIKEIEILATVGRGHPVRKMTATHRNDATQVSALTWAEIQIAMNATHGEIGDSVAKLVANKLIDSGRQNPTFWGRLRGDRETYFFWITEVGRTLLNQENSSQNLEVISITSDVKTGSTELDKVEKILVELGYDITPYGVGVAFVSLESGYSAAETSSYLALVSLAQDCRSTNDIKILMILFEHAMAMIKILAEYRDAGQIRLEFYNNDVTAMAKVSYLDKHTTGWIEKVLSDPIIQKDRVATSRIDYGGMFDFDDEDIDP